MAALIGLLVLGSTALAANAGVAMRGAQFVPAALTINVGDTVTWTNEDGIPHSARADNGSFDTGIFSTGARSVTFNTAGTFGYFCAVHPSTMRGTVNVVAAATPPPPPPPTAPPTARPTAVPTARPSPPPPTIVPSTPSASPVPSAAASPTAAPEATATAVSLQVSPTPRATATPDGSSRSGDDAPPLLLLGVAGVVALAGAAFALSRRR